MVKVFISHSSQDREVAEGLVELLRAALSLKVSDIRCTSVDGYRLAGGADVDEEIRRELLESPTLIGLLSTASIESYYVMFELGGRWGVDRPLIPLLAPGADASLLKGPLAGKNALRCDNAASLHQLVGETAEILQVEPENPEVYQKEIDDLLALGHSETREKALNGERPLPGFFRRFPRLLLGLALGLFLLLGGIYLALRLRGNTSQDAPRTAPPAIDKSKPFEILAVTVLLQQTDSLLDGKEERHLNVRTQYTIRGLAGLPVTADGMAKRYTKSDAREIRLWRGNVEQAVKGSGPTNLETVARFGIVPGEVKSLAFGAKIIFDLPFSDSDPRRKIHDLVKLKGNEAWWGYPNHDGMTIPVVTIFVESETNDLGVTEDRSAFRLTTKGDMSSEGMSIGPRTAQAGNGSLWVSWHDVKPEELVAFKYTWGARKVRKGLG